MEIRVTPAVGADAAELADVAAATFPLACPDTVDAGDVEAFIAAHLTEDCFDEYLADPARVILIAVGQARIIGYTMLIRGSGDNPTVELSKMYVLPGHHGTGAAAALMQAGVDWAERAEATAVWLGVNQRNTRAQRFYRKQGFEVSGERTFRLGGHTEHDFLMTRRL